MYLLPWSIVAIALVIKSPSKAPSLVLLRRFTMSPRWLLVSVSAAVDGQTYQDGYAQAVLKSSSGSMSSLNCQMVTVPKRRKLSHYIQIGKHQ